MSSLHIFFLPAGDKQEGFFSIFLFKTRKLGADVEEKDQEVDDVLTTTTSDARRETSGDERIRESDYDPSSHVR